MGGASAGADPRHRESVPDAARWRQPDVLLSADPPGLGPTGGPILDRSFERFVGLYLLRSGSLKGMASREGDQRLADLGQSEHRIDVIVRGCGCGHMRIFSL
jgi:hypothetical protein